MIIGKVIGNVWATRKLEELNGLKLMIVEPYQYEGHEKQYPVIAADMIGVGIGETALMVTGSTARIVTGETTRPVDCTIVGIIDQVEVK